MSEDARFRFQIDVPVSDTMRDKWTPLLNVLAEVVGVPAALIMRVHPRQIEVFARSTGEANVYEVGERADLNTGLYCETVMETRAELLVPDALADPVWRDNPDVPLGMISYLGVPVLWPTGEVFGTICILDTRPNAYSSLFRQLLRQFRAAAELDLAHLCRERELDVEVAERRAAEAALRKSEQLREDLVQMLVHDMRAPLASLAILLDLLREDLEGSLSAEQRQDFGDAIESGRRLARMIGSLLDVHRLEAGQMPLSIGRCDLRRSVEEALAGLAGLTADRDVRTRPASEPVEAACDPVVVRRVIENLVCNALRFTPTDGTVEVEAGLDGGRARVTVSDTGPGIAEEHQPLVFEKYGQVHSTVKHIKLSTGLGLTFCKLAVEAQGGSIELRSRPGEGSAFSFVLPSADSGPTSS